MKRSVAVLAAGLMLCLGFADGCVGNLRAAIIPARLPQLASPSSAPAPTILTSLAAIHSLSNAQAGRDLPVDFQATVTYSGYGHQLFVQDGDAAIYVYQKQDIQLLPGDRVRIQGVTQRSFRPVVVSNRITLLHHGKPLTPVAATYSQLIESRLDCRLVTVHATIRTADLIDSDGKRHAYLEMLDHGRPIDMSVDGADRDALRGMLDAEVNVTGVEAGIFDSKMQQTGIMLHADSMSSVKILRRAPSDPWTLPVTPMDNILPAFHIDDRSTRLRVHGTITYYQPGAAAVLQNGPRSLWIDTRTSQPLAVGDIADATGFPAVHDGFLNLVRGEIRDTHARAPIVPLPTTWQQLTVNNNFHLGHIYDLVSIRAVVVGETQEDSQDEYVLSSNGHLFTAIYRHRNRARRIPPMKQVPLGSTVQVTGICIQMWSSPFNGSIPFNILLRSFDDITVISKPSPLNIRNLILLAGLLLLAVIAAGARGWILDRKVRRQTAALTKQIEAEAALERRSSQLEQQRSHILEEINGSTPLDHIMELILEMVSFMLNGAPCWCETANGVNFRQPPSESGLRVESKTIRGRSEPVLGTIFIALNPFSRPSLQETEALTMGTRLASLAIETRRLYSDLLRRSEFDLLTDTHNRFSFEKHLDFLIQEARLQEARENAGMLFGLIYIDLDDFKQVNDVYGHQVGDLYLQEAALRMKHQLRPMDMLARLGGDEFAALVPLMPSRAEVVEIAHRLERCFDEPFEVQGEVLVFSASIGIALYPEDATTQAGLLSTADAAMYVVKKTKKQSRNLTEVSAR